MKEKIKKHRQGFLAEFKKFITRGNVLDMAVGVIIGGAFTSIVNSVVKDILNPIIGALLGNADFSAFKIVLKAATEENAEVAILYGSLISAFINFILIALVLFIIVRFFNRLNEAAAKAKAEKAAKEAEEAAAKVEATPPPAPVKSDEVVLLEQIVELLKK